MFSLSSHFSNSSISFLSFIEQEQHSAAQIVQVVVAGNSVQIQHGLLNGQVMKLPAVITVFIQHPS